MAVVNIYGCGANSRYKATGSEVRFGFKLPSLSPTREVFNISEKTMMKAIPSSGPVE